MAAALAVILMVNVWLKKFLAIGMGLVFAVSAKAETPSVNHLVFAHYMVCFATYGPTVDGYKRDILEAQAAGLDGFALNVGAWSGPDTYYKQRVKLIYDAAEQLGTGFKLFFSIEIVNTNDIFDIISTYGKRPNSFRHSDKVVVSTYGQNQVDWKGSIFAPLKVFGIDCFFVPHFWSDPVQELPSYLDGKNILQKYDGLVDGLFLFGAAGLPAQLARSNANYTKAAHDAGKVSMASVTPNYWGAAQYSLGRRYFESDGYEGLMLQWNAIIANQPDWVEIVTWNDWNESSYMSGVDDPGKYNGSDSLKALKRHSHSGYLELSKRYIAWYKTGQEPATDRDALFYSYRTHSKDLVAKQTNDAPVMWFLGDCQDVVYTTCNLTSPAVLEIQSGDRSTTNSLSSGITHVRVPFSAGRQTFTLRREGGDVVSVEGVPIASQIDVHNYFPATGYAYGPIVIPEPPPVHNLRIVKQ